VVTIVPVVPVVSVVRLRWTYFGRDGGIPARDKCSSPPAKPEDLSPKNKATLKGVEYRRITHSEGANRKISIREM
jgi:hypothetical protein